MWKKSIWNLEKGRTFWKRPGLLRVPYWTLKHVHTSEETQEALRTSREMRRQNTHKFKPGIIIWCPWPLRCLTKLILILWKLCQIFTTLSTPISLCGWRKPAKWIMSYVQLNTMQLLGTCIVTQIKLNVWTKLNS